MGEIEFAVRYIIYSALAIAVYEVLMEGAMDDLGREENFQAGHIVLQFGSIYFTDRAQEKRSQHINEYSFSMWDICSNHIFPGKKKDNSDNDDCGLIVVHINGEVDFRKPEKILEKSDVSDDSAYGSNAVDVCSLYDNYDSVNLCGRQNGSSNYTETICRRYERKK